MCDLSYRYGARYSSLDCASDFERSKSDAKLFSQKPAQQDYIECLRAVAITVLGLVVKQRRLIKTPSKVK